MGLSVALLPQPSGEAADCPQIFLKYDIAMENGPFIVDFPIENGDFP